jgi:hypothetical protein
MRASIYSTSELHLSGSLDLTLSAASVTKISAFEQFRYCTTSFKVFVNGGDGIFRREKSESFEAFNSTEKPNFAAMQKQKRQRLPGRQRQRSPSMQEKFRTD